MLNVLGIILIIILSPLVLIASIISAIIILCILYTIAVVITDRIKNTINKIKQVLKE